MSIINKLTYELRVLKTGFGFGSVQKEVDVSNPISFIHCQKSTAWPILVNSLPSGESKVCTVCAL